MYIIHIYIYIYYFILFYFLQIFKNFYVQALLFAPWPATNERTMWLAEQLVSCKPNLVTVLDNTPSVQDGSLLATCLGNRSAVLYELGRLEVASSYKS